MKQKILEKLLKWWPDVIFVDPCPMPFYNVWEVKVDGKVIKIVAANRVLAYIIARVKYPGAKRIQVVKLLKTNRYA
jgi:hypothetical protein